MPVQIVGDPVPARRDPSVPLVVRPALTYEELPPHEYRHGRCRLCGLVPSTPLDHQMPCLW